MQQHSVYVPSCLGWADLNEGLNACDCPDVFALLQETAAHIRGIRQWVTNEYAHSGIRDDGARIFEQLLAMARGSIPLC